MNQIIMNNSVLHLAKSFLASILSTILFWVFYGSILTGHFIAGFVIFVMFSIIAAISLIQMILFIKKAFKANKK